MIGPVGSLARRAAGRRAELATRTAAEQLIRQVAASDPDVVALAEVVALAVHIDPALLRAARRTFLPHRGPDLEADLWHSSLVTSTNATGLTFEVPVAESLLYRLARHQWRCQRARLVVAAAHGGLRDDPPGWLPDTLRLEEELRYLTLVPDGSRRAQELLEIVDAQVNASGADGRQAWLRGMASRLPPSLHASARGPDARWVMGMARDEAPAGRSMGVRLLDKAVELSANPQTPRSGSGRDPAIPQPLHHVTLPAGAPPAVFVDGRRVSLETLPHIEPVADPGRVVVETLDGERTVLHRRRRQNLPRRPPSWTGHEGPVLTCAFSPDGSLLASAGDDGTARLWDAATGRVLHVLSGHTRAVRSCAFSPDGALLATASADRTVRLWSTARGEIHEVLTRPTGSLGVSAFSPDGMRLVSAGESGTVQLWDLHVVGENPDRTVPASWSTGHAGAVGACAFSPDGTLLATVGNDRRVRVWHSDALSLERHGEPEASGQVPSGAPHLVLRGHTDAVVGCAFSPDGKVLATTSHDRTVRLWDPVTGALVRTLFRHVNSVWGCAFSPDGSLLATCSSDGTVRLWDPVAGTVQEVITGHEGAVRACAFSPDGALLASAGADRTVRIWDPTAVRPRQLLDGHTAWVYSCSYAPDGSLLATSGADRTVRVWDPPTGAVLHTLDRHQGTVDGCAFSPDGKLIATASADATVGIWEAATGELLHQVDCHGDRLHACVFSPDGTTLATVGADAAARLWDPISGALLQTLVGHRSALRCCAFSPDGTLLATSGDDTTIRLWDPRRGTHLRTLSGHIREVLDCAFSHDGTMLATVSNDQTIRLWDPVGLRSPRILRGHVGRIHACAFSPDGSCLATAGADRTVRLWDPVSGKPVGTLTGTASMLDVAFAPHGGRLATTGAETIVQIWDLLHQEVAPKGDTVGLWLGGGVADAAAIAGAVAARPFTASCSPVVAAGGGALVGVLLAAGIDPRQVRQLVVGGAAGPAGPLALRRRDPVPRLARHLARLGLHRCGDLRVAVDHPLHRYRFHAVLVDVTSSRLVVLPRDARRIGLTPDDIPLAELALAATGLHDEVTLQGRRFTPVADRSFDPGPWWDGSPNGQKVLAVDVESRQGLLPARRFPATAQVTTVSIPWLYPIVGVLPSRRQREVLARIGTQSYRTAAAEPAGR